MRIPVFGDIHGNIEGMLFTLQYLQRKNQEAYPYVFQVGDFGYFPAADSMDSTTRKRAMKDESEEGVMRFLAEPTIYERFFVKGSDKLTSKIYFIRGNHEDQERLHDLASVSHEGAVQADSYGVLHYLPDGRGVSIPLGSQQDIIVVGFGGVSREDRPKACSKQPLTEFSEEGLRRILNFQPGQFDVLLTHQGPETHDTGDTTITTLCDLFQPRLHVHGHEHVLSGPKRIRMTASYSLARVPPVRKPEGEGFLGFIDDSLGFTTAASRLR